MVANRRPPETNRCSRGEGRLRACHGQAVGRCISIRPSRGISPINAPRQAATMSMPGSFHEEEMDETSDDLDWTPPAEESEVDGFELEIDESDDADAFEDEDAPAAGAADDEEISFEVDPQTMHVHVVQGNRRSVVTQGTLAQSPGLAALLRRFLTSPPPEDREVCAGRWSSNLPDECQSEEEEDPYDNRELLLLCNVGSSCRSVWGVMYSRRTRGAPPIFKVRSEPDPKGAALLNGGEFVRVRAHAAGLTA
jgi:hypothetical protein